MSPNVAALDCGSNSTRLLVVDENLTTLAREMRITRLSEGVDATGALAAAALARSYEVLAHYRRVMDEHRVERGLLVATSAVRDAVNGAEFLERAAEITRVPARVLRGEEEAAFSYAGATRELVEDARPTLVLDIGGGSSELAVRLDGVVRGFSMQLGCVRVTERALGSGVVTPVAEAAARAMIATELDRAFTSVPELSSLVGNVRLVGLAGTVATLAQLDAQLSVYERTAVHHRHLTLEDVVRWRTRLGELSPSERLALAGMVPGREDVLVAGLYILSAVMERFGVDDVLSSEDDILDGVASSLI